MIKDKAYYVEDFRKTAEILDSELRDKLQEVDIKIEQCNLAINAIERDIPKERTYLNTCPTCGKVVVNIFGNLLCSNPNCRQAIKQE